MEINDNCSRKSIFGLSRQKKFNWYLIFFMNILINFNNSFTNDFNSFTEKDVNRTDRTHDYYSGENNPHLTQLYDILMTYVMYNFDLGYVQGMSDLLSPILCLMDNEVDAFWCFVGFMNKVVCTQIF